MKTSLLDDFLAEECPPSVRAELKTALQTIQSGFGMRKQKIDFNRFAITLAADFVLLEDILDATEAGEQYVPTREFLLALER